ncbi:MAG: thioredoxin family protein [Armatimonadetes bacterium]|nr:thioredoxin family protein [Armatimonadota bacterium]
MSMSLRWVVLAGLVGLIALAAGCGAAPREQVSVPVAPAEDEVVEKGEIAWMYDYEAGLAAAREADKPVMIDVFATWCGPCKLLDENVFSRADVAEASQDFVTIRVDGDQDPDTVNNLRISGYPTVLFLTPDGKEIGRSVGAVSYSVMLTEMEKAKERYATGS